MGAGTTITVRLGGPDATIQLRKKVADLGPALKGIGAIVVAQGRRAFREQKLGDVIWPERYPGQKEPFINIAPVVFKAGEGKAPTADDFRRRPALGGVGSDLAQSLSFRVAGNTVEAGSPFSWAGLFNFGGIGRIAITDRTRTTLGTWLFGTGSTVKAQQKYASKQAGLGPGGKGGSAKTSGTRADYARKLAFVFKSEELVQGAYPRPFIGFTDETFDDVTEELAKHFGGTVEGAAA